MKRVGLSVFLVFISLFYSGLSLSNSPIVIYFSDESGGAMFSLNSTPSSFVQSTFSGPVNEMDLEEKILVVLADCYGSQRFSKIVITDVDMVESILIAKDVFDRIPSGIYTVIASSANDLVSHKLIIQ